MTSYDFSFIINDKIYTAKFKLIPRPTNNQFIVYDIHPADHGSTWNLIFTAIDVSHTLDYGYSTGKPDKKEKEFKTAIAAAIFKKCILQDIKMFNSISFN